MAQWKGKSPLRGKTKNAARAALIRAGSPIAAEWMVTGQNINAFLNYFEPGDVLGENKRVKVALQCESITFH